MVGRADILMVVAYAAQLCLAMHPRGASCARIVQNLDAVKAADVVICITGMDGGLASVVAGMVEVPVIALPTSTGYGAAFSGVAPMLAALNSSAPGVTVVNIDSGFGASMAAWRILKNASRIRQAAMGK
ncbi:Pyridinium-3 [Chlorella vulgaris]